MKKLCLVATAGNGVNVFMLKHIQYLRKYYDVTLIIGDDTEIRINCKVIRIKIQRQINLVKDLKSLFQLYGILKKEKYDLVLSLMPKSGLLSMLSSCILGVPTRIHFFTGQVWATKKGLFRELLKGMDKIIVRCSTEVLIDSKSQKQFLINEGVLKSKEGYVLKNGSISGVDVEKFKVNHILREELRKKYNIQENEIVFMFLGRINKDKGILDLNEVFLQLFEKYNHIKLVLIGPLEDDTLKNKMNELLNHPKVIAELNFINNPEEVLNMTDVLVLPSYREGFGTIVIEAASMEIPTIGSNIYGLSDAIVNNETGILHQVKNIEDMVDKYSNIIENNLLIKQMGYNGKKMVLEGFVDNDLSKALVEFIYEKNSFN